jgi:hypothetical protein
MTSLLVPYARRQQESWRAAEILREADDPASSTDIDPAVLEQLRTLGYLQ